MKKFLAVMLIVVGSLLFSSSVNAMVQLYEATEHCIISDFETLADAKEHAQRKGKQNAILKAHEMASVFVKTFLRSENIELTDDEIKMLVADVAKINAVQYEMKKIYLSSTLYSIEVTVKIEVDTDEILKKAR